MYSGLLPRGLTKDDLSPDDEEDEQDDGDETRQEGNGGSVLEEKSAHSDVDSLTSSMPGISQEMWKKFQVLRKKKEEIKAIKIPTKRRSRRKGTKLGESPETRERQGKQEKHWNELKQYFGVNDRFQPPACSKSPPKSGLEKNIEEAIAEGDIEKAEEMSDRLATREMAVKIAKAADCRDFVQHKQEEEALRAAQKRKKQIAWGFEAKKRWETKSNMGFM